MPKFSYQCSSCLYTMAIIRPKRPDSPPSCSSCGAPTQKLIANPQVVIKGAAFRNGYYVAPTNSELGLPTEHEVLKNALRGTEEFVDPNERDLKKDFDDEKKLYQEEVKRKVARVKEKNPELYQAFKSAQDRVKQKKKKV